MESKKNASKPDWIFTKGKERYNTFQGVNFLFSMGGDSVLTTRIKGLKGGKEYLGSDEQAEEFAEANGFELEICGQ
jgi:hypothetical protein